MSDVATDTSAEAAVRADVRAFLAANWRAGTPRKEWLPVAVDSGWAAPGFPAEWHGKGLAQRRMIRGMQFA